MTGPGDEIAAAGGRGRLRASHPGREQVIATLKAAYVQGMLAKDELDARLGQAFASRTYGELAAVTADLPAGLADIRPPRQPAQTPARPAASKVIAGAALVIPPAALLPPAFFTSNDKLAKLCLTLMFFYLIAWMIAATVMLDSWLPKPSRGQLPPPPAPRGPAPERGQDGGSGYDRTLCQGRSGARPRPLPGHGAIRRLAVADGTPGPVSALRPAIYLTGPVEAPAITAWLTPRRRS